MAAHAGAGRKSWHGGCEGWYATQKAAPMSINAQIAAAASGPSFVLAAIREASAKTGSDFDYLLRTAMRESGLKPDARSTASSATGLFQFIEQTWLGLVRKYGAKHGLGSYAAAIAQGANGRFTVNSAEARAAILALRKDAGLSALMAGEAANETRERLECSLGREVSCGELYAAHFLGQGGACRLIEAYESDPAQRADALFPQAAAANRSVFYQRDGRPKSVGELYAWASDLPGAPLSAKPAPVAMVQTQAARFQEARLPSNEFAAGEVEACNVLPSIRETPAVAERNAHPPAGLAGGFSGPRLGHGPIAATPGMPPPPLVLTLSLMEIFASLNGALSGLVKRGN